MSKEIKDVWRRISEIYTFGKTDEHLINDLPTRDLDGGRIKQYKIEGNWYYRNGNQFDRTIICRTKNVMDKGVEFLENL